MSRAFWGRLSPEGSCTLDRPPPSTFSSSSLFLSTPAEVCAGRSARAAGRDSVPLPAWGRGSYVRVRRCDNGGRRAEDSAAHHQAAGQNEPWRRWLFHQPAAGEEGSSASFFSYFSVFSLIQYPSSAVSRMRTATTRTFSAWPYGPMKSPTGCVPSPSPTSRKTRRTQMSKRCFSQFLKLEL